jgi:HEAT repeat protein
MGWWAWLGRRWHLRRIRKVSLAPREREAAIAGLAGDRGALQELLRIAGEPSTHVLPRRYALQAIGRMGAPEAAAPLLKMASNPGLSGSADAIFEALAAIGGAQAREALAAAATSSDAHVRACAVEAIAAHPEPRWFPQLVENLRYTNDKERRFVADVRASAAKGLGALRNPQAIGPLLEAVECLEYGVAEAAATALAAIGDRRAVPPLLDILHRSEHYPTIHGPVRRALADLGWKPDKPKASDRPGQSVPKAPLLLIRNMQARPLPAYGTEPGTCSACRQEAVVVVAPPPAGDLAVGPGEAIPPRLAGRCNRCQKVFHLCCARPLNMAGGTVFRCPHRAGEDGGVLRSH